MRRVLTGYATSFNRRNKRDGHLFQNRFKSTVVDEERYFLGLVRYIHLNPLRARMVEDLNALGMFSWSGHSVLMGKKKLGVQDVDAVLGRFGGTTREARRELLNFMGAPEAKGEQKTFKGGGLVRSAGGIDALQEMAAKEKWAHDERILGSGEFVEAVLQRAAPEVPIVHGSPEKRVAQLEKLVAAVSEKSGIQMAELTGGGRRRDLVRLRQAICYVAVRHIGLPATIVGRMLQVSNVSVLSGIEKGETVWTELGMSLADLN